MEPLGFQLHPLPPWSPKVFLTEGRGLLFSSHREAGGFTLARKCQIRGKIRGKTKIRGKFPFSRLNSGKRQPSLTVFDQ